MSETLNVWVLLTITMGQTDRHTDIFTSRLNRHWDDSVKMPVLASWPFVHIVSSGRVCGCGWWCQVTGGT